MKNILFVIPTFEIGGTVVSTKNLILLLDKKKYNVTVLSMTGIGSMKGMYRDVQQILTTLILSTLSFSSYKDAPNLAKKIICGFIRVVAKYKPIRKLLLQIQAAKLISYDYDLVVACEEGVCSEFVSYVKSSKKIAWIRCDYSRYIIEADRSLEEIIYSRYDNIVCVSDITTKRFITQFPQYTDKTICINNPQSEDYIWEQSLIDDGDLRFQQNVFTIVSIGRFNPIKRFTEIPNIASFLLSKDMKFRWYIIGDGLLEEKQRITENIIKEGVEEHVICLGIKTNPHFYIRHADLLVCLSTSEACPRVINEAKILHVPVVCTNFDTSREYIDHMETGIISSLGEIKYSILKIMQDKKLNDHIKSKISTFHFSNDEIMNAIQDLFAV